MDVPQRIEVAEGTYVVLTWDDGDVTELTAAQLRAACQCAACREPSGREATRRVLADEDAIRIRDASLVGGYAVSFVFDPDAHGSGIYSFELLRALGVESA